MPRSDRSRPAHEPRPRSGNGQVGTSARRGVRGTPGGPVTGPAAARKPVAAHLGDFTLTPRVLTITALALVIGGISALVADALLKLIGLFTNLFFYQRVDTGLTTPAHSHLADWWIVLIPVLGGLVVGLMARYGSERIRGHGMPEAIEAILTDGSKVKPRVAILKPISAAISIGSGGPFGAEGPIIMTGGAFGSVLAQFLKLTADERKTLLVAGAAGGMAATFNTPLAAVLLAVELLLFEWRPRSVVPVVASVVVATIVRGYLLGTGALFPIAAEHLHLTGTAYAFCVVAGIVAGLLAVAMTALVYAAEDTFRKLPIHWMWWPAIGGAIIGIGGIFVPQALGVGYDVIGALLQGHIALHLVVGILIVKTLIWSLSLGSGTSGGVLAPMFMIGGALGALEGQVFPHVGLGFWALVSLAGVLGGVMRSPFTGVVFALELTHEVGALLPMLITAGAAYGLSALVLKRSILTEKVARRGFHLSREYDVDPLEVLFVREVMATDFVSFHAGTPLREVAETFVQGHRQLRNAQHRQRLYPVLDDAGRLVGVVTRRDMLDTALSTDVAATAGKAVESATVRQPLVAHPDETLRTLSYRMAESGVSRMPVVPRDEADRIVGMVTLVDLLQGRLVDLEEQRDAKRILGVRTLFPTGPGRLRAQQQEPLVTESAE